MSELRTPEQLEWIRERFKPDGLERLARSTQEYYDQKGYYLPDVAALAYANGAERDALAIKLTEAREALRQIAENDHPTRTRSDTAPVSIGGKDGTVTYVETLSARQIARAALGSVRADGKPKEDGNE